VERPDHGLIAPIHNMIALLEVGADGQGHALELGGEKPGTITTISVARNAQIFDGAKKQDFTVDAAAHSEQDHITTMTDANTVSEDDLSKPEESKAAHTAHPASLLEVLSHAKKEKRHHAHGKRKRKTLAGRSGDDDGSDDKSDDRADKSDASDIDESADEEAEDKKIGPAKLAIKKEGERIETMEKNEEKRTRVDKERDTLAKELATDEKEAKKLDKETKEEEADVQKDEKGLIGDINKFAHVASLSAILLLMAT